MSHVECLGLLEKELVITVGWTESIAVAYAAAVAKSQILDESIEGILVRASQGVIKNALAVNVLSAHDSGLELVGAVGSLCLSKSSRLGAAGVICNGGTSQNRRKQ